MIVRLKSGTHPGDKIIWVDFVAFAEQRRAAAIETSRRGIHIQCRQSSRNWTLRDQPALPIDI